MGVSGFFLELLVPGLVSALAVAIVGLEFELLDIEQTSAFGTTIILSLVFVLAYLGGITIRHSTYRLVPSSVELYHERLLAKWPKQLEGLYERWLEAYDAGEGDPVERFTPTASKEMLAGMTAHLLATQSGVWGEYLLYQKNIARVSVNSLVPMGLVAISCLVGFAHRIPKDEFGPATLYIVGFLAAATTTVGLRTANRQRRHWYVDFLVRTELSQAATP